MKGGTNLFLIREMNTIILLIVLCGVSRIINDEIGEIITN